MNSVIQNNPTNGFASGAGTFSAMSNWWVTTVASDIDSTLQGPINRSNFLLSEPLLTPAIGTLSNVTQVGSQMVNLRLACRTADSMRLSEDSTFTAVFYAPFTNSTAFQLSAGGGLKTVFAQFRQRHRANERAGFCNRQLYHGWPVDFVRSASVRARSWVVH